MISLNAEHMPSDGNLPFSVGCTLLYILSLSRCRFSPASSPHCSEQYFLAYAVLSFLHVNNMPQFAHLTSRVSPMSLTIAKFFFPSAARLAARSAESLAWWYATWHLCEHKCWSTLCAANSLPQKSHVLTILLTISSSPSRLTRTTRAGRQSHRRIRTTAKVRGCWRAGVWPRRRPSPRQL